MGSLEREEISEVDAGVHAGRVAFLRISAKWEITEIETLDAVLEAWRTELAS